MPSLANHHVAAPNAKSEYEDFQGIVEGRRDNTRDAQRDREIMGAQTDDVESTSSGSNVNAASQGRHGTFFKSTGSITSSNNEDTTYHRLSRPNTCMDTLGSQAKGMVAMPISVGKWVSHKCKQHYKKIYLMTMVGSIIFILFAQLTMSFSLEYEAGITAFPQKQNGSAFNYNMWDGMFKLWERGSYTLVFIIGLCSGLWPYIKALALLAAVDKRFLCGVDEYTFNSIFFQLGKWSFIDVWVVIVAVLAVQVHRRISVFYLDLDATARQGIYLFFSATLVLHFVTTVHFCSVARRRRKERLIEEGVAAELLLVRHRVEQNLNASVKEKYSPISYSRRPPDYPPSTPVVPPALLARLKEEEIGTMEASSHNENGANEGKHGNLEGSTAGGGGVYIPTPSQYSLHQNPQNHNRTTSTGILIPQDQERSSLSLATGDLLTRRTTEQSFDTPVLSQAECDLHVIQAINSLPTLDTSQVYAISPSQTQQSKNAERTYQSALQGDIAFVARSRISIVSFCLLLVICVAFFIAMTISCFQINITVYQFFEYSDIYSVIESLVAIWKRHKTNAGLAMVFTLMVVIAPILLYSLVFAFLCLRLYIEIVVRRAQKEANKIANFPKGDSLYATKQNPHNFDSRNNEAAIGAQDHMTSPLSPGKKESTIASSSSDNVQENLTLAELHTVFSLGSYWRALWWIRETIWMLAQWSCLEGFVLAVFILGFELPLLLTEKEKALVSFSLDKMAGLFTLMVVCFFQLVGMQRALLALCPDTSALKRILSLRSDSHLRYATNHKDFNKPQSFGDTLAKDIDVGHVVTSNGDLPTIDESENEGERSAQSLRIPSETRTGPSDISNTNNHHITDFGDGVENIDSDADVGEFPEGLAELNRFAFAQAAREQGAQEQRVQVEAMQDAMKAGARERALARARARAEEAVQAAANMTASGSMDGPSSGRYNAEEVILHMPPRENRLDYARKSPIPTPQPGTKESEL